MSGAQKILFAARGFIAAAPINLICVLVMSGGTHLAAGISYLIVACVLGFMLLNRANWARWVVGFWSVLAALVGILACLSPAILFSPFGFWMVPMTVFYAWTAHVLLRDKDVSRHFGRHSYL